ncbi:ComGF family competence protein [Virgibacillus sp. NKC19-3]|uniref:ComGF family competence protein n=1 Tax=Virgibacillus saliphilus TaxID=2831674 RepID=UPI001C9B0CBA|nr:ComGF family competence protein [Virgibacillus sp. NKC19-3]MBY7143380.1 ComGF family competence protein [Virgibacillus sp. NKC19-3]
MSKIAKKLYVYMAIGKNDRGFTLVSILFSISIIAVTLPFTGYLINTITDTSSHYEEVSTHQFFHFLRDDVIKATSFTIESSALILTLENETTATIEKYGKHIRRKTDHGGHEIYLRDIEDITFTELPYGIHATVTSMQGEQYEKTIIFYE